MIEAAETKSAMLFARASPRLVESVQAQAKEEEREQSEVVRRAVQQYIDLRAKLGPSFDHIINGLLGQQR